jgi:hypothetical protein
MVVPQNTYQRSFGLLMWVYKTTPRLKTTCKATNQHFMRPQRRRLATLLTLVLIVLGSVVYWRSGPVSLQDLCVAHHSHPQSHCSCVEEKKLPSKNFVWLAVALVIDGHVTESKNYAEIAAVLLANKVQKEDVFVFHHGTPIADAKYSAISLPEHTRGKADERYKFILDVAFQCHPRTHTHLVVVDDALRISRNFLTLTKLLIQNALLRDPHLFAAALVAAHGYPATASDPTQFHKTNSFLVGAWVMSRRVFTAFVQPAWRARSETTPFFSSVNFFSSSPNVAAEERRNWPARNEQEERNSNQQPSFPPSSLFDTSWTLFAEAVMAAHNLSVVYPEVARAAASLDDQGQQRRLPPLLQNQALFEGGPGGIDFDRFGVFDEHQGLHMLAKFDAHLAFFIRHSPVVPCPAELPHVLWHGRAVVPLAAAASDLDPAWDALITQIMGLDSRAGPGARPAGIYRGTLPVRWRGNLVLFVAPYSPFVLSSAHGSALVAALAKPPKQCPVKASPSELERLVRHKDRQLVLSGAGQSCDAACKSIPPIDFVSLECHAPALFLANDCALFQQPCDTCTAISPDRFYAPAVDTTKRICMLAAGDRSLSCDAVPPPSVQRLCACVPVGD